MNINELPDLNLDPNYYGNWINIIQLQSNISVEIKLIFSSGYTFDKWLEERITSDLITDMYWAVIAKDFPEHLNYFERRMKLIAF